MVLLFIGFSIARSKGGEAALTLGTATSPTQATTCVESTAATAEGGLTNCSSLAGIDILEAHWDSREVLHASGKKDQAIENSRNWPLLVNG